MTGCRTTSPENQEDQNEPAEAPRDRSTKLPIGTIHLVDQGGEFVLIKTSRFNDVEPDSELVVMDERGREVARLSPNRARKGDFLTADILYGVPQAGNHVLVIHRPRPVESPAGASPGDEIQVLE